MRVKDFRPSVSVFCPFCHRHTDVTVVTVRSDVHRDDMLYAWWQKSDSDIWWLGRTHCCNAAVLVHNNGDIVHPAPQPAPTDDRIPSPLHDALDEAKRCVTVRAWRGCAVLARRAIQAACVDKGAPEDKKLVDQISHLVTTGVVTKDLKTWADEVRYAGNDGAHPKDTAVSQDDAEDILKLAEQFLHVLYVAPAIAAERRAARVAAKENSEAAPGA
jgi:hypothetical protein